MSGKAKATEYRICIPSIFNNARRGKPIYFAAGSLFRASTLRGQLFCLVYLISAKSALIAAVVPAAFVIRLAVVHNVFFLDFQGCKFVVLL